MGAALLWLAVCAAGPVPLGEWARCRYTVRDIGFVDLSGPTFALTRVASESEPLEARQAAEASVLCRDSNVVVGALNSRAAPDDPRARALPAGQAGWVLGRPGLEPLLLPLEAGGDAAVRRAFSVCSRSPARDELVANALAAFATVLLVEGEDAADNRRALEQVESALQALDSVASSLPRPIEWPVATLTIGRDQRDSERVLLWSLGPEAAGREPAACVIYARGRLAGPVMRGASISRSELLGQLALVGESCECDTDRDWVSEPSIPLRWSERQQASAAEVLGFDPESPLVRAEVLRILSRPLQGRRNPDGRDGVAALVLGYRETSLAPGAHEPPAGQSAPERSPVGSDPAQGRLVEGSAGDDWGFEEVRAGDPAAQQQPLGREPPGTSTGSGQPFGRPLRVGLAVFLGLVLVAAALVLLRGSSG